MSFYEPHILWSSSKHCLHNILLIFSNKVNFSYKIILERDAELSIFNELQHLICAQENILLIIVIIAASTGFEGL